MDHEGDRDPNPCFRSASVDTSYAASPVLRIDDTKRGERACRSCQNKRSGSCSANKKCGGMQSTRCIKFLNWQTYGVVHGGTWSGRLVTNGPSKILRRGIDGAKTRSFAVTSTGSDRSSRAAELREDDHSVLRSVRNSPRVAVLKDAELGSIWHGWRLGGRLRRHRRRIEPTTSEELETALVDARSPQPSQPFVLLCFSLLLVQSLFLVAKLPLLFKVRVVLGPLARALVRVQLELQRPHGRMLDPCRRERRLAVVAGRQRQGFHLRAPPGLLVPGFGLQVEFFVLCKLPRGRMGYEWLRRWYGPRLHFASAFLRHLCFCQAPFQHLHLLCSALLRREVELSGPREIRCSSRLGGLGGWTEGVVVSTQRGGLDHAVVLSDVRVICRRRKSPAKRGSRVRDQLWTDGHRVRPLRGSFGARQELG
eukprot:scaffold319_cov244-Pinguiococcus_pyrenoidosus.AAC.25